MRFRPKRLQWPFKSQVPKVLQEGETGKIWKELSAMKIDDPKLLLDDTIILKHQDQNGINQLDTMPVDIAETSSDLPMSPIMDAKSWKLRFREARKPSQPHISLMTERERDVMKNPYAAMLATPVRQDFFYLRSLPRFFLQKFQNFVHPDTKDAWILPSKIRARDESKVITGLSRYSLASKFMLDFLKSSRWKKIQGQGIVQSGVWRTDMADFVHKTLRQRVCDEVSACQRWIMSANKVDGKWMDMKFGCILVWEPPEEKKISLKDASYSLYDLATLLEKETAEKSVSDNPQVVQARVLVKIRGRLVPQYDMPCLVGTELASELKKRLKIEDKVKQNIILLSTGTVEAQMWLWRSAGFLRQPREALYSQDGAENDTP